MQCPKCGKQKHRIPESRRSEQNVWRRRICSFCHHQWITQEVATDLPKMPTQVHQWKDLHRKQEETRAPRAGNFDTSGIASVRW